MTFCYHRCYSTEPKSFRRTIDIYASNSALYVAGTQPNERTPFEGKCNMIDDMYYCGADPCEQCDYEF